MSVGELFCLTVGDIPLDRGGVFKFGNFENRKGAAKPRPLCTPLGLFLSSARDSLFLFVDLCLYASILSALLFADIVYFCVFSVFRFWRSACMLRYLMRYAVPMRHTAISRSESQVRGGRLLVVTLAEPP